MILGKFWEGALLCIVGFGLIPVLQNLYLLRLGFDVQFIGLLVGLGQVVWAAAALPAGPLSNRIGLRNALVLGYSLFGLGLALWLGPILACGAIALMVRADPVYVARQDTQHESAARAPLALLAFFGLVVFLGAIGEGTVRAFFNVYLDTALGVAPAAIGSIMGLAQLLPIAAALAVPFLVARWGTGYALAAGLLGVGKFLLPLAAVPLVWVAAVAYMGVIALITMTGTTRDMFGQELVLPRWRTSSQGVAMVGLALGWALAGIGGGALIKLSGSPSGHHWFWNRRQCYPKNLRCRLGCSLRPGAKSGRQRNTAASRYHR